jgi:hypothetical protein
MPLSTLLGLLIDAFRDRYPRWRDGDVPSPLIVDRETFARFRETVIESRDALLNSVLSAADCFLPTLLHPKQFDTIHAEGLWGGELPLGDLSTTLERVVDQIIPGDRQVALRR